MNLNQFTATFKSDPVLQTQFVAKIAAQIAKTNIQGIDAKVTKTVDAKGDLQTIAIGQNLNNSIVQMATADAAISVLKDFGVTDFKGLKGIEGDFDPLALNIVYKGGGWVVNT